LFPNGKSHFVINLMNLWALKKCDIAHFYKDLILPVEYLDNEFFFVFYCYLVLSKRPMSYLIYIRGQLFGT